MTDVSKLPEETNEDNKRRAQLALAREQYRKLREGAQLVRQINTMEEARDPKLLEWCLGELSRGKRFEHLRRNLGLGNAAVDARWRYIRGELLRQALPGSEDDALLAAYTEQDEVVDKLQGEFEKLEEIVDSQPYREDLAALIKSKIEVLKLLLEERKARFSQYVEMSKLKKGVGGVGISIILQTNVPRPKRELNKAEPIDVEVVPEPDNSGE